MAQITTGIRSVLSSPFVYDTLQLLVGGLNARRQVCAEYVTPLKGQAVLDVGCGTATLLRFLPEGIRYFGFDLSPDYIAAAQRQHGSRGTFMCANVEDVDISTLPAFDYGIAMGVLHHLDDGSARRLIDAMHDRVIDGGKVVFMDPVVEDGQSRIARFLIENDRGQNVRTREGYLDLVPDRYSSKCLRVHSDYLLLPYSMGVMVATK